VREAFIREVPGTGRGFRTGGGGSGGRFKDPGKGDWIICCILTK